MRAEKITRCSARAAALFLVAFIVPVLVPVSAKADARADRLIDEGLRLRRDGKPEQALEVFRQAHAIAPSPRTFGQMGLVEASLTRWVDGETHLAMALSNPDDAWVIKNRAFLDQALALCRQHIGDLVVTGPAGAQISVDGKPVGTLPAVPSMRIVEGTVAIAASAPGFAPFAESVVIHAGARTPLAISLTPLPAAAPESAAKVAVPAAATAPATLAPLVSTPPARPEIQSTATGSWHTWTGISLMAVGGAALAWGITWIAIDGGCPLGAVCDGPAPTSGRYETRTPGWILTGVGVATAAGGAVILLTRPSTKVAVGITPSSVVFAGRF